MAKKNSDKGAGDVDHGWAWTVAVAVFVGRLVLSTSLYMSGVFYISLLDQYNEDEAKTSIIGSLNSGLLGLFGPFVSILIDATSCRTSMFIGGLLLSLSYVVSAFVDNVNVLILTLGVIGGIGNSLTSVPFSVSLGYYFHKHRNVIIAASTSVIGLAMFIASPLVLYMLATYGLKGTFIIVGGINAQLCVISFICKPSSEERNIQNAKRIEHLKDIDTNETLITKWIKKLARKCNQIFNFSLLSNVSFVLLLLSTMSWNFMLSVCLMHLPNFVVTQGLSSSAITIIMTTFGIANTVGRFLAALTYAKNRIDALTIYTASLLIAGLFTVSFPFYSNFKNASFIFAGVVGFFTGVPNSLTTPVSLSIVGADKISSAHGLENFFCGIGVVVGPPIAGGILLLGCLLAILTKLTMRRKKKSHVFDEENGNDTIYSVS
ncbi:hypothetical protein ACF0H5_020465 [Mactra antiquata]